MNKNNRSGNKKEIKKINIYAHIYVKNYPWKDLRNKVLVPYYTSN